MPRTTLSAAALLVILGCASPPTPADPTTPPREGTAGSTRAAAPSGTETDAGTGTEAEIDSPDGRCCPPPSGEVPEPGEVTDAERCRAAGGRAWDSPGCPGAADPNDLRPPRPPPADGPDDGAGPDGASVAPEGV